MSLFSLFLIAAGGAIGALLRFATVTAAEAMFPSHFPWGTLTVNLAGSLVMGPIMAICVAKGPDFEPIKYLVVIGMLGSFTTFSAFSYDFFTLVDRGEWIGAFGYVVTSVILSLAGLAFGYVLTNRLIT